MTCKSLLFYLKHIAVYKLSFNVKDSNNTIIFAIKKFSFLLFPSLFPSSKVFSVHHSSYVTHLHMMNFIICIVQCIAFSLNNDT